MTTHETTHAHVASLMERILYEVKKLIVGQDNFLERVMVAMLAQGQAVAFPCGCDLRHVFCRDVVLG